MPFFLKSFWSELRWVVRVSRPRFWIYLFGPFLIGIICALRVTGFDQFPMSERWVTIKEVSSILFLFVTESLPLLAREQPIHLLRGIGLLILAFGYFLLPGNLWLYGINDVCDRDTDALNPKKEGYELRIPARRRWRLLAWTICLQLPWVWASVTTLIIFPLSWFARCALALVGFLFLSVFYSAPPIRAKARPFLDSVFNVLYLFPALASYFFLTDSAGIGRPSFPWLPFFAGCLWCMAMHAYSAVPDIKADTQAGLQTIATQLGSFPTLILCLALYISSSILGAMAAPTPILRYILLLLGLPYVLLIYLSLTRQGDLLPVYKRFPWVNTLVGTALFFALLLF